MYVHVCSWTFHTSPGPSRQNELSNSTVLSLLLCSVLSHQGTSIRSVSQQWRRADHNHDRGMGTQFKLKILDVKCWRRHAARCRVFEHIRAGIPVFQSFGKKQALSNLNWYARATYPILVQEVSTPLHAGQDFDDVGSMVPTFAR